MDRLLVASRYLIGRPICLVSLLGVLVGVGSIVVVDSVMNGFLREQMKVVRGTLPDVTVRLPKGRREQAQFVQQSVELVEQVPGVVSVARRLEWPSLYQNTDQVNPTWGSRYGGYHFLQLVGLDLEVAREKDELMHLTAVQGEGFRAPRLDDPFWYDPHDQFWKDRVDPSKRFAPLIPVLFGEPMARLMNLRVGSVVSFATFGEPLPEEERFPRRKRYAVVTGTYRTEDSVFERTHAFVPRDRLQEFAGVSESARELAVRGAPGVSEKEVRDRVRLALSAHGLASEDIQSWQDQKQLLLRAIENERIIMNIVLFFLILVAGFNLLVTLSMMVSEKVREIGILVSMGASSQRVASIFLGCGFLIAILGAVAGLGGGLLLTWNINPVHDFIAGVSGIHLFDPQFYSFREIPTEVDGGRIAWFVVSALGCSMLFTLFPSFAASRMEVVDALRRE